MLRLLLAVGLMLAASSASAQIDPERRRILHFGYDKNVSGPGPTGLYLFFYSNQPNFMKKGTNLRLAIAPVFIDGELGKRGAITKHTDLAIGLAGGGYAYSHSEVRGGHYFKDESFNGHGASASMSVYHLLNPGVIMPLSAIARLGTAYVTYQRRSDTRPDFKLPPSRMEGFVRFGLRLGGEPPELLARKAGELSIWYEGRARTHARDYGLENDRTVQSYASQGWARLRFAYRTEAGPRYEFTTIGGVSGASDRFSAYRLGGLLPFGSEFPLALPGYYAGELSARRFALFSTGVGLPVNDNKSVSARLSAASANVSYLAGMAQPKPWNSSVGTSLTIEPPESGLRVILAYGYGFDAIRSGHRGAHNVTLLTQLDFEALRGRGARAKPVTGLDWVFQIFRP